MRRSLSIAWVLTTVLWMTACGGSGGGTDSSGDLSRDLSEGPDLPATDVPGSDATTDPGNQEVAPPPDAPPGDPGSPDAATDEGPEIPWDTLPKLPADKTFTTPFAAGAGQGDVSPRTPCYLGGFGFCLGDDTLCRKSDGVHDPLLASAVAIADTATGEAVILIGVDTIGLIRKDIESMHQAIQMRLYEDFGVYFPGERAIISASHAHSSCDTIGLWGPMGGAGRDETYTKVLEDGVVKAARDAFANLQDARLEWGQGTYRNSDEDAFADDQDLFVIRGKKPDDTTIFTLIRWPGHPTTYGDKMHATSADYVGTLRKKMQDVFGGVHVFLQGPIGSVYPERPATCGLDEEAFPEGDRTKTDMNPADYMKVTCTGYAVAQAAIDALEDPTPLEETGIEFRHSSFFFHPDNEVLMMLAEFGPLPYDWVDVNDPNAKMRSIFSVARVGSLTFVSTPGESFPVFARMAKDIATEAGLPTPVTLGLAQDWMGYLLNLEQWQDINLSYHQSLSPGKEVYPAFETALRQALDLPPTD